MMEVWKGGQSQMLVILVNKQELNTKLEISCFLSATDHDLMTFIKEKDSLHPNHTQL